MIRLALALASFSLAAQAATVTRVPSRDVGAAFAKGMPLLENEAFKVHASRRETPGLAEVHVADTDVIHVLEGRAAFVTGGVAVEAREVAPGELRGASIAGGDVLMLAPGDVVVVPAGVPHWFKEVDGPLLYYVVKVAGCGGAP